MLLLYQTLLLYMQQQLEKERSISGLYYILQGKQSIQTIQDAHLFGLDDYFSIFKKLQKQQFMKVIHHLESQNYLHKKELDNHYELTEKGREWLFKYEGLLSRYPIDGQQYHHKSDIFYARLLLLIQVLTNAQRKNFSYIPIIENKEIENWVKIMYQKSKRNISRYLQQLMEELTSIFVQVQAENAVEVWVEQLTGYQWIGKTMHQLAEENDLWFEDVHLMTTSVNHFILKQIEIHPSIYPLLSSIAKMSLPDNTLTESARITNKLLLENYTLEEIANRRRLKLNTIYDHIVEISLHHSEFPLHLYVSIENQKEIYDAVQQLSSFKLRSIKEKVSEHISYFEIRLVLTRIQTKIYSDKSRKIK